jgi:hypothetical protein
VDGGARVIGGAIGGGCSRDRRRVLALLLALDLVAA